VKKNFSDWKIGQPEKRKGEKKFSDWPTRKKKKALKNSKKKINKKSVLKD
jgi:hypothetical protein